VRAGHGEDDGDVAQDDDQPHVLPGKADRGLGRAEKIQNGIHERPDEQRIEQGDRDGGVKAEGAHALGVAAAAGADEPRDEAAAADAEEIGKGDGHHEDGERERDGGRLVGVARHADVDGVHHVVDEVDELADDRGHRHGGQSLRDGHGFKQLLLGG